MKPYKIALLTGTHQHRWADDGSGICEKCGREHSPHIYQSSSPNVCRICGAVGKCQHTAGFVYSSPEQHRCKLCYSKMNHTQQIVATASVCWQCPDCGYSEDEHNFSDGICSVCEWVCPHLTLSPGVTNMYHYCALCGKELEHQFEIIATAAVCMKCSACGYLTKHIGITGLGQSCSVCGYLHETHLWNTSGTCTVCGAVCPHEEINSIGNCTVCGIVMNRPDGIYGYGASGGYDGSYLLDQSGEHFDIYRGFVWSNGTWVSNGYNLFMFDIREDPVQFGGDYAYKITGYVFTKSNSVNVSPSLLTANGVRNLKLAQYNLDGGLREADTTGYTAADCIFKSTSMNVNPTWSP